VFVAAEPGSAAPPDPLDVLERVVRGLGDELAFFRRRALDAERRLRDVLAQQAAGAATGRPSAADLARLGVLETENVELRARIADAAERARAVAGRMRFARQQDDAAHGDGGG